MQREGARGRTAVAPAVVTAHLCRAMQSGILRLTRRPHGHHMLLTATAVALALSAITGGVYPRADSLLGTGVSRELATVRAAQIRDVRYALSFDLTERDS